MDRGGRSASMAAKPEAMVRRAAKKATEVFETVELMEQILLQTNVEDILRAMQAVKCMRNTVNGSTKIKKQIGLLPDKDSDFHTTLWPMTSPNQHKEPEFHGVRLVDYDGDFTVLPAYFAQILRRNSESPLDVLETADFNLICKAVGPSLTRLGRRVQNLGLCQPPAIRLKAWYSCQHCLGGRPHHLPRGARPALSQPGVVLPKNGHYIVLDDIQRAIVRIRQDHRKICKKPKAKSWVDVEFSAEVQLRKDDPMIVLRCQQIMEQE